ncbi:unnamed protein product [Nesidiocoris tenuis]|uniref:BRCT domain-containing protein n=1 Tax=Nesidiocoris tenuis TaxID=355587 RepID=A0A6H5HCR9_9HEMI|nr:unnamed protein product [Nesidiocoris tenuis]
MAESVDDVANCDDTEKIINGLFSFLPQAENRLKPFHGARVCFAGFAEDERKHMAEILVENGGTPTDIEDPACSHVVSSGRFLMQERHAYPNHVGCAKRFESV